MSKTVSNRIDAELGEKEHKTPWLALILPLILVGVVLSVSPNFKSVDGMRSGPLGSDFLQEWIGGTVIGSTEPNRLYDLQHVQAMQHDSSVVGFDWPQDDYFPMVYPPFYYAAVRPLAALRYPVSMKLWALLSALAFSISGYLLYRFYPPCRRLLGIFLVVALVFVPLLKCFNMGQKSTFLLLILTGSFVLLHNRRPITAGMVFGLIVFKPHLGIVIGLAMLLKRQWRFAAGAVLTVLTLVGGSYLVNPQLCRDYLDVVSGMGNYVQTGGYQLFDSHSLWGAAQLTFSWLSPIGVKLVVAALSLGVAIVLWRVLRGQMELDSPRFARQFAALVFATVILSPHFYTYDLTILLLPMLLIVSSNAPGKWRSNSVDRTLGFVLMGIFAFAGMFAQIAGVIRVQPSIVLMIVVLVLLGVKLQDPGKGVSYTSS